MTIIFENALKTVRENQNIKVAGQSLWFLQFLTTPLINGYHVLPKQWEQTITGNKSKQIYRQNILSNMPQNVLSCITLQNLRLWHEKRSPFPRKLPHLEIVFSIWMHAHTCKNTHTDKHKWCLLNAFYEKTPHRTVTTSKSNVGL